MEGRTGGWIEGWVMIPRDRLMDGWASKFMDVQKRMDGWMDA